MNSESSERISFDNLSREAKDLILNVSGARDGYNYKEAPSFDLDAIKRYPAPSQENFIIKEELKPVKEDEVSPLEKHNNLQKKALGLISLHHWLEDFDNADLSDYDRKEQLRNAVIAYNQAYKTEHDPDKGVKDYLWEQYKEGSESAE